VICFAWYVPRGVVATPRRFDTAAAIVRSSSMSSLPKLSSRAPSLAATADVSSVWRIPAASLTISITGQYVMPSP
jgi:hypothetical protein